MKDTWYVMTDGSVGDPAEISPDKDGVLTHKDGRKVAYAPHGPRSRSVDTTSAPKRKPFGGKGDHDGDGRPGGAKRPVEPVAEADDISSPAESLSEARDMTAEKPKRGYKTRESKAD